MWYQWIHPVIQALATVLGLYVLFLGWSRFQAAFMGRKKMFQWKRHVALGKVATALWALGLLTGLWATHTAWMTLFVTGGHAFAGLAMVPFLALAWASGWVMDTHKKRRKALPLAHAVNGLVLALLALYQVWSGIGVLRDFVIP